MELKPTNQGTESEPKMEIVKNIVDLDDAIKWTRRWRDRNSKSDIISFRIPSVDMIELMGNDGKHCDVRAYMAIKDDEKTTLLLVGVDENGEDMLDFQKGQFVYDFTGPCPTLCASNSPLFKDQ